MQTYCQVNDFQTSEVVKASEVFYNHNASKGVHSHEYEHPAEEHEHDHMPDIHHRHGHEE
jgi:hypothetical protein